MPKKVYMYDNFLKMCVLYCLRAQSCLACLLLLLSASLPASLPVRGFRVCIRGACDQQQQRRRRQNQRHSEQTQRASNTHTHTPPYTLQYTWVQKRLTHVTLSNTIYIYMYEHAHVVLHPPKKEEKRRRYFTSHNVVTKQMVCFGNKICLLASFVHSHFTCPNSI